MKIGICGSRSLSSENFVKFAKEQLELIFSEGDTFVAGGAIGADTVCEAILRENGYMGEVIKPDYNRFGKTAPLYRNEQIVRKSDKLVVFWDGKSNGTKHCATMAKKYGVQVISFICTSE